MARGLSGVGDDRGTFKEKVLAIELRNTCHEKVLVHGIVRRGC